MSDLDRELLIAVLGSRMCNLDHAEGEACSNPSIQNTADALIKLGFQQVKPGEVVVSKVLIQQLVTAILPPLKSMIQVMVKVMREAGLEINTE